MSYVILNRLVESVLQPDETKRNHFIVKWLHHGTLSSEPAKHIPDDILELYTSGSLEYGHTIYPQVQNYEDEEDAIEDAVDQIQSFNCDQKKEELKYTNKNKKVTKQLLSIICFH